MRVLQVLGNDRGKGHVPLEVALLPHLEFLEFVYASLVTLEWLLPLDIPNTLPSLTELRVYDSDITGIIPTTIGLLTSLSNFYFFDNGLESTIPSELGLLSKLTSLIRSKNRLSGTIPEEIGDLPFLVEFEVEDNPGLEPPVPSGFCSANRTAAWKVMKTDWCTNPAACCANA